eukprot:tig00000581_g2217.t1
MAEIEELERARDALFDACCIGRVGKPFEARCPRAMDVLEAARKLTDLVGSYGSDIPARFIAQGFSVVGVKMAQLASMQPSPGVISNPHSGAPLQRSVELAAALLCSGGGVLGCDDFVEVISLLATSSRKLPDGVSFNAFKFALRQVIARKYTGTQK